MKKILGIDIGGSGVKGAIVDISKGEFISDRVRIPTPQPYALESVLDCITDIVAQLKYKGPIGVGFPGVIRSQVIQTAANIGGEAFIGVNLSEEIGRKCGYETWVVNDADAAGSAEVHFGAGKKHKGTMMMLTIGTGIGTALFINGELVPNMELGHLRMKDKRTGKFLDAEKICSDASRKKHDIKWDAWAERFSKYVAYLHSLLWMDYVIIGGGISAKPEKFIKKLDIPCDIAIAKLENKAGIIGAAFEAYKNLK